MPRGVYEHRSKSLEERLYSKTQLAPTGCLEWQAQVNNRGYGMIYREPRGPKPRPSQLAHRVAWELKHGPIPDNLFVLHVCDNRSCVNTDHLFLGDHATNMQDMAKKNRKRGGAEKITEEKAAEIRRRYQPARRSRVGEGGGPGGWLGGNSHELAEEFGITAKWIRSMVRDDCTRWRRGINWRPQEK